MPYWGDWTDSPDHQALLYPDNDIGQNGTVYVTEGSPNPGWSFFMGSTDTKTWHGAFGNASGTANSMFPGFNTAAVSECTFDHAFQGNRLGSSWVTETGQCRAITPGGTDPSSQGAVVEHTGSIGPGSLGSQNQTETWSVGADSWRLGYIHTGGLGWTPPPSQWPEGAIDVEAENTDPISVMDLVEMWVTPWSGGSDDWGGFVKQPLDPGNQWLELPATAAPFYYASMSDLTTYSGLPRGSGTGVGVPLSVADAQVLMVEAAEQAPTMMSREDRRFPRIGFTWVGGWKGIWGPGHFIETPGAYTFAVGVVYRTGRYRFLFDGEPPPPPPPVTGQADPLRTRQRTDGLANSSAIRAKQRDSRQGSPRIGREAYL